MNFTDLEVAEIVPPTQQNKNDLRGGFVADGDNDGRLEVYILSRDLNTVFATEWIGDPGGDVTDPFNYQTTALYFIQFQKVYPQSKRAVLPGKGP